MQTFKKYKSVKQDGRRKIQEKDKKVIRELLAHGTTQAQVAEKFGISIFSIYNILHPEYAEIQKESRKGTWKKYYNKERRNEIMQRYRDKKRALKMT